MTTVLVIDGERAGRRALTSALRFGGYDVNRVEEPARAASAVRRSRPDLVIVGEDVVSELRPLTQAPIIVVAPSDDPIDKVAALDAGADDYVVSPFDVEELLARVRVALRRMIRPHRDPTPRVTTADFTIDLDDRRWVRVDGTEVGLTPIEWRIVEVLVRRAGHLVTQHEILEAVWGPTAIEKSHYLRVQMASIRRKVEPEPNAPRYFITAPGLGMRFDPCCMS